MTADEDGVRTGEGREVCLQEIADMDVDARSTKTTGILLDDGLALRTDLKSADLEMRELQTGFDRDAGRSRCPRRPSSGVIRVPVASADG